MENYALESYKNAATQTASPAKLIQMLYDGAIRFLEFSLAGFKESDPLLFNRTVSNNIIRAQAIINELNGVLDMEQGGELAVKLRDLYLYMDSTLQTSNAKKEMGGVQDVINRLRIVRESWSKMMAGSTALDLGDASRGTVEGRL